MIEKAILKINSNAKFTINANDINQITWLNDTTPISKEDIEAMIPTVETEIEQEKQDAIDKKASGKQKLKDLGLDDAEIKALIGA
jgi:transcriptional regulator NrdR family protein